MLWLDLAIFLFTTAALIAICFTFILIFVGMGYVIYKVLDLLRYWGWI